MGRRRQRLSARPWAGQSNANYASSAVANRRQKPPEPEEAGEQFQQMGDDVGGIIEEETGKRPIHQVTRRSRTKQTQGQPVTAQELGTVRRM